MFFSTCLFWKFLTKKDTSDIFKNCKIYNFQSFNVRFISFRLTNNVSGIPHVSRKIKDIATNRKKIRENAKYQKMISFALI